MKWITRKSPALMSNVVKRDLLSAADIKEKLVYLAEAQRTQRKARKILISFVFSLRPLRLCEK